MQYKCLVGAGDAAQSVERLPSTQKEVCAPISCMGNRSASPSFSPPPHTLSY
jgi:hypothetical protein